MPAEREGRDGEDAQPDPISWVIPMVVGAVFTSGFGSAAIYVAKYGTITIVGSATAYAAGTMAVEGGRMAADIARPGLARTARATRHRVRLVRRGSTQLARGISETATAVGDAAIHAADTISSAGNMATSSVAHGVSSAAALLRDGAQYVRPGMQMLSSSRAEGDGSSLNLQRQEDRLEFVLVEDENGIHLVSLATSSEDATASENVVDAVPIQSEGFELVAVERHQLSSESLEGSTLEPRPEETPEEAGGELAVASESTRSTRSPGSSHDTVSDPAQLEDGDLAEVDWVSEVQSFRSFHTAASH